MEEMPLPEDMDAECKKELIRNARICIEKFNDEEEACDAFMELEHREAYVLFNYLLRQDHDLGRREEIDLIEGYESLSNIGHENPNDNFLNEWSQKHPMYRLALDVLVSCKPCEVHNVYSMRVNTIALEIFYEALENNKNQDDVLSADSHKHPENPVFQGRNRISNLLNPKAADTVLTVEQDDETVDNTHELVLEMKVDKDGVEFRRRVVSTYKKASSTANMQN